MHATWRRSLVPMVVIWLVAGPASAAVTSTVSAGVLTAASDAADAIAIDCTAPGGNVTVNGANPGTGAVACALVTRIVVNGGPGANTLSLEAVNLTAYPGLATTSITGGLGDDILIGSAIGDSISGNDGNDLAFMGEGDDLFTWNPGDDNDVLEGQGGTDLLLFNGANVSEIINVSANGVRTLFTRNIAIVAMDLGGVERVEYNALGGADTVTVNSLATTQTTQVRLNLAGTLGGSTGDGQADGIVVAGSAGDDIITTSGGAQVGVVVSTTTVLVTGAEPLADSLAVNAGSGDDTLVFASTLAGLFVSVGADGGAGTDTAVARGSIAADTLVASSTGALVSAGGSAMLTTAAVENLRIEGLDGGDTLVCGNGVAALYAQVLLDGGVGDDTVTGGNGAEVLIGGPGVDTIDGNVGSDVALLGDGNDTFNWDPGDGSDVVEGQAGTDLLRFNGSNGAENLSVSANGVRARVFRDIGAIDMDLDDVEQIDYAAVGGADSVVVGDLVGTDVARVRILLAATLGGSTGDAQPDTVTVNGGNQADAYQVGASAGVVSATRGAFTLDVLTAEPANDRLVVNGLGGDDSLALAPVAAIALPLNYRGGDDSGVADAGDVFALVGEALAEIYTVTPVGNSATLARTAPVAFAVSIDTTERLQLDLGNGADSINTQPLPATRQVLDGGSPASLPGDSLNVANFSGDVFVSPIVVAGLRPIAHQNFEQTTNQQLFEAFPSGRQQTPPNPSPALGFGSVTLNAAQDAISVSLGYSGLLGLNNAVRIQGPAPRGVAGLAIFDLPSSGATSGSFTVGPFAVTPTQVAQLKQGLWYLNASSTAPGSAAGEIRGQLDGIQFRDGFE